ncbi:MAG TPA: PPC domain-containing protein, partial [Gemmataceae bacterium]|nr:PPC domain-containing protein [Gemmataceae bacterium]
PAPAPAAAPKKPADSKKKPPMPAAKPAVTKFKVTIAPNTPPGYHDVRLVNSWGISNPRAFVVGDLPEVQEKEPNNDDTQAQKVPLNCTVNGTIASPTDVDFYVFPGTKGQRVVVSCLALSIDSRLQPELEVYDSHGRLLGGNYRYQGNRHFANSDSLVDCSLPEDGDYYVRVAQFTYTEGDPQHFYRLTISTAPWIDAVFPVAVEAGKPAKVTVYGRNLPGGQPDPSAVIDGRPLERLAVTVDVPPLAEDRKQTYRGYLGPAASALDGFEYRLRNSTGVSNPVFLTYAKAPVVADNEANDTPEKAQEVPLPCEIAGHVEKLHDRDWYAFTAKKGDHYNIEVISDRLEAPTDMYFILQNAATKQNIIEADDNPDTFSPKFFARTDDPAVYRFTVPQDGKYLLLVASRLADTTADPRHQYVVRITPDQPDFRLAVMPADFHRPDACCVRQGGSESFSVFAWRQDGFRGDIELSVEGLPKGVTCAPQVVGGAQRQTSLVLSGAADAPAWTGTITVKGTATIRGKKVVREARPASIVWGVQPQANIPTVTRLDHSLVLAVRDKAPFRLEASIDKAAVVQGAKGQITLKLTRLWPEFKTPLQVLLMDPVQNLIINNNQPANIAPGKDSVTVPVTVNANLAPGTYNIVFRGQAQIPFHKDPKQKQRPNTPVVLPSSALTLTVLPKALANVSLQPQGVTVKVGKQAEFTVRVNRLFEYDGEFKVEVVVPPSVKGVTVEPAVIPAGKNEVKVVVKAAADAAPGNRANLVARAIALFNGKVPTKHEVKFNVNVVK